MAAVAVPAAEYAMALTGRDQNIPGTSGRSDDMYRTQVSRRYSEFSFCGKSCSFNPAPQDGNKVSIGFQANHKQNRNKKRSNKRNFRSLKRKHKFIPGNANAWIL